MRELLCRVALLIAASACTGITDMPADEPCKNVAYTVASRTQACLGDGALANARYGRFRDAYTCTVTSPEESDFRCADAVNGTTCDAVVANGEAWDRWLLASPACGDIFRHKDGTPAFPEAGDEVVSKNAVCQNAADKAIERRRSCSSGAISGDKPAGYAELDPLFRCTARWPDGGPPPFATACTEQLGALACASVPDQASLASFVAAAPACAAILVKR